MEEEVFQDVEKVELDADAQRAFSELMGNKAPVIDEPVIESTEESEEAPEVVEVTEETPVVETAEVETPVASEEEEEGIEDRITSTYQAPEKVETKKEEPVADKKEVTKVIPFKNDLAKIIYNASNDDSGISIAEIESLYNKSYDNLDDLSLIKLAIESDPKYAGAPAGAIKTLFERRIMGIQGDLDLEDANDAEVFNSLIALEAKSLKATLDKKRDDIIEKYSSDVTVTVESEVEQVQEVSEEDLIKFREEKFAEALNYINTDLPGDTVVIEDKDGPINIKIQDKAAIANSLIDPAGFIKANFTDDKGNFDTQKFARWVNYAVDMNGHDNTVIKRGISIGKKATVSEIKNQKVVNSRESTGSGNRKPTDDIQGFANAMANVFI